MKKSTSLFSVKGKAIILTGGVGYLGAQYAEALAQAGAQVIVWDMSRPSQTIREALYEVVDITSERAVQNAVKKIIKKFGRIDALINNAALNPAVGAKNVTQAFAPYEEYPIELWEKELKVNLTGTMICIKAVATIMMKQKSGSIVNVASDLSLIAHDHRVYNDPDRKRFKSIAYTTTKSGILGLTRQWAARLGHYGVRVNAFSPTGMRMDTLPKDFVDSYGGANMLGRMAEYGEYSGAIIFLCSNASSMMTGANLVVDGGKTAW